MGFVPSLLQVVSLLGEKWNKKLEKTIGECEVFEMRCQSIIWKFLTSGAAEYESNCHIWSNDGAVS